jgi:lysophospholipase L1-like esterase
MKRYFFTGSAVLFMLAGCKPHINPETPSKGDADFTTYVAIGNSLTAGYADASLYRSGQQNAYPALLAEQFKMVGGGDFKQPLLPGEAGWPGVKRVLGYATDCNGVTSLSPVSYSGTVDTAGSMASIAAQGPYNNVGVPGIRCIDYVTAGYAAGALMLGGVGYAYRFYPNPLTNRPLDVAALLPATFFTIWLGNNDVLGYATGGGEGAVGGTGTGDISSTAAFKTAYDSVVNVMTANGAKGVLINIPDVTTIPFFTTIPFNGLVLDSITAANLSTVYSVFGISFQEGPNRFIIEDSTQPYHFRQIEAGEYLLLTTPQDSLKCSKWGSLKPIPRKYVLDKNEVANVKAATAAFNQIIADNAQAHGLALVDANSYMKSLQSGIIFNGVTFTPTFVSGGAFSLDGIHLTPRGYALVANEIIRKINATYHSSISYIDVNRYNGILFP